MVRHGRAWQGLVRHGLIGVMFSGLGRARQGVVWCRHGVATLGMARFDRGKYSHGGAVLGMARQGVAGLGEAWHGSN